MHFGAPKWEEKVLLRPIPGVARGYVDVFKAIIMTAQHAITPKRESRFAPIVRAVINKARPKFL